MNNVYKRKHFLHLVVLCKNVVENVKVEFKFENISYFFVFIIGFQILDK